MKYFKKIISTVLLTVATFAVAVPVLADTPKGLSTVAASTSQTMKVTVTGISGSTLKTTNGNYTIKSADRSLVNATNNAALQKAIISGTVKNKVFTIESITIKAASTALKPITLKANNAKFSGAITVATPYFTMDKLQVQRVNVTPTVKLAKLNGSINDLRVQKNASPVLIGTATIKKMYPASEKMTFVEFNGTIETMSFSAKKAKVQIGNSTKVTKISGQKNITMDAYISNYFNAYLKIGTFNNVKAKTAIPKNKKLLWTSYSYGYTTFINDVFYIRNSNNTQFKEMVFATNNYAVHLPSDKFKTVTLNKKEYSTQTLPFTFVEEYYRNDNSYYQFNGTNFGGTSIGHYSTNETERAFKNLVLFNVFEKKYDNLTTFQLSEMMHNLSFAIMNYSGYIPNFNPSLIYNMYYLKNRPGNLKTLDDYSKYFSQQNLLVEKEIDQFYSTFNDQYNRIQQITNQIFSIPVEGRQDLYDAATSRFSNFMDYYGSFVSGLQYQYIAEYEVYKTMTSSLANSRKKLYKDQIDNIKKFNDYYEDTDAYLTDIYEQLQNN